SRTCVWQRLSDVGCTDLRGKGGTLSCKGAGLWSDCEPARFSRREPRLERASRGRLAAERRLQSGGPDPAPDTHGIRAGAARPGRLCAVDLRRVWEAPDL